jgi:uroporphyrinogen decarboxylase
MTNKQNAMEIIKFGKPERIVEGLPGYTPCYFGCNHEGFDGGSDDLPVGSKWKDIWQTEFHKEHADVMGFPKGNPLSDMDQLKKYQWPDPNNEHICGQIYKMAADFPGGDLYLTGSNRDTLWEKAYMLVGMENMMAYFYTEPEYAREVLHRIMDFQLGIAAHYVSIGIEFAHLSDDLGTQDSLILSPGIINEFLVPEYRRLFNFYKSHHVMIGLHSCGHIEPLLDTYMDIGVDVLHPVQATANNLSAVRKKTQGRMALAGGVSTQIIMEGPVQRIKDEVKKTIKTLGEHGGYFCSPDQGLPFPKEHYEAFEEALDEYGSYPIKY